MKVHQSAVAGMLVLVNDGKHPVSVAGRTIFPEQSLEIPHVEAIPYLDPDNEQHASFLPTAPKAEAPETPEDPVEALAGSNAKDVIAAIDGLTDEQLQQLEQLEEAKGEGARKTVLGAIQALQLKRAEEQ